MSKHGLYEIRFRPTGTGKNGGNGSVKSFLATLSSPKDAKKKLRCRGEIISVRRAS